MDTPLLLTGLTKDELVEKLLGSPSPQLAEYFQHLCLLARNNPFWFSPYSILAWLVTEEVCYREPAREHFLTLTREKDAGLVTNEVQVHTHTATAPLVHTMVFYDWIHGTGLLTPAEEDAFADAMLDFGFQTALVQLRGRVRSFDNQVFSSAISATFIGAVLGRLHGEAGRARMLYTRGHEWLVDQLGLLTDDCYSLEGSTYHELIVIPMLTLASAFLEEWDDMSVYSKGVNGGTPLRDWLLAFEGMIGESGLLPGWDQYGVMLASAKLPLVYRARQDGCAKPLAKVIQTGMWYPLCHSMWEMADRLWTLVWWNDEIDIPKVSQQQDWLKPRTAGAIHYKTARLFQYWDETSGAPNAGRPQVNPNAIQFDHSGLPLLLDGEPAPDPSTLNLNIPAMRDYLGDSMLEGLAAGWGGTLSDENVPRQIERAISGCLGGSNSLVIDGEDWYVPINPVRGKGTELRGAGTVRLIESDAAAIYADRYDLSSCIRTSILIGETIVLAVDRVRAESDHTYTWQAFTWPGAELRDGGAVTQVAASVQLDLLAPHQAEVTVEDIDRFPRWPTGGSSRVRMSRGAPSASAVFPVCLVAQKTVSEGTDIAGDWIHAGNGKGSEEVDLNRFYLDDDAPTGTLHVFEKDITLNANSESVLRLACGGPTTRLFLNDVEVAATFLQESSEVKGRNFNFPLVYALGAESSGGSATLRIETENFHGESIKGPVLLQESLSVASPSFTETGAGTYWVTTVAGIENICLGAGEAREWQGGTVNATAAVKRSTGEVVLLGVTAADLPTLCLTVSSTRAIDLSFTDHILKLGKVPLGTSAVIRVNGSLVQLDTTTGLAVSTAVTAPLTLCLECESGECLINGKRVSQGEGVLTLELEPQLTSANLDLVSLVPEVLYRYAEAPDEKLEEIVLVALACPDWRVQVAGADLAGRFRLSAVVPELLRCFEEEKRSVPIPQYTSHWIRSKMNNALAAGVDHAPDPNLDPVRDAKGGRLRQAVILALGLIGDRRACEALRAALQVGTDHFLTLSQIPVALARLGDHEAIPLLREKVNHSEVNVRGTVNLALARLEARMTQDDFEKQLNS